MLSQEWILKLTIIRWFIHNCFILPFQKFFISSKTYEPFMYLAVPVPNPALVSYQVGFISQVSTQGAQCILYVSVQIEPDSKITTLIKSVLEKLKNDDNVKPNAVKLYEVKKARLSLITIYKFSTMDCS